MKLLCISCKVSKRHYEIYTSYHKRNERKRGTMHVGGERERKSARVMSQYTQADEEESCEWHKNVEIRKRYEVKKRE